MSKARKASRLPEATPEQKLIAAGLTPVHFTELELTLIRRTLRDADAEAGLRAFDAAVARGAK